MSSREKVLEHFRNPEVKNLLSQNIEKYRKTDGILTVTDSTGKPLSGV